MGSVLRHSGFWFAACGFITLPIAPATALTPQAAQAAGPVQGGVDAWETGDYAAAMRLWLPAAEGGNGDAQFNLGQAYKLGRGVPVDFASAQYWFRRAAAQGHLQAEDNLAILLFTTGQREAAMPLIHRSAARGDARAMLLLGTVLFNGDLAPRDWPRAYALVRRASDAGLGLAKDRLVELDRLIPADQRQKGLTLLPELQREENAARLAPAPPIVMANGALAAIAAPTSTPAEPENPPQTPMINLPPSRLSADLEAAAQPDQTIPAAVPAPRAAPGVTFALPPETLPPTPPAVTVAAPVPIPVSAAAPAPAAPVIDAITTPAPLLPGASTTIEPAPDPVAPKAAIEIEAETETKTEAEAEARSPVAPTLSTTPEAPPVPATQPPVVLPSPVASSPIPSNAAAPSTTITAPSRWHAQLGAFSIAENANKLWFSLSARHAELQGRAPIFLRTGRLTRLLIGGFESQQQAASLCASLRGKGQPCILVRE